MKKIKIFQEDNEPVVLHDFDSSDLYTYTKNITKILEVSNVAILETSSGCFIARPYKICGLLITNEKDNIFEPNSIEIKVRNKGTISKYNNENEIITDKEKE